MANKVHNLSHFPSSQKLDCFSLQYLIRNVLFVAQCFALLPLNGITKEVKSLEFKWRSIKTVYTIFTIILLTFYSTIVLLYCISNGENFLSFAIVVWNVRALIGILIFVRLARKWPLLLQHWTKIEADMLDHGALPNLKLKFQILPFIFLVAGLAEHVMFVYGGAEVVLAKMGENDVFLKQYFEYLYVEFFSRFEYNIWKALLVEFLALVTTFEWQFCDLLIVLLSAGLAERFQQITNKINEKPQTFCEAHWRDLRKQYNNLSLLCKTLNGAISEVILLSFFTNSYFVSTTVFQFFTSHSGYESIYCLYNTLLNLLHFIIVCIYASWVHEESLEPLSEISSVPAKYMSHEVDRLLQQMSAKDIAIHGDGLFKITRSVILNVASAVVTLQLIFVQFKASFASKIKLDLVS